MIFESIKRSFGLDFRSMSLYRVLLGIILILSTLYRIPDITAFYTDQGILSRQVFLSEFSLPWSFSFHLATGSYWGILAFFIVQIILGFMVFIGYQTRLALLFSYILNVSVHNRNWLINNGGDDVLRVILFLSIFLPLDHFFSVDAARKERHIVSKDHTSPWTLAFFIQVFAIYFVSYILKDDPVWRGDYSAVYYALRVDALVNPIGVIIREWPLFIKASTIFTIFLEWAGPIILLFSFTFGRYWWIARTLVVLCFWGLHFGILLTMWIGFFPYTCIVMWTLFIPSQVWDYLGERFKRPQIIIYYDEECGFCHKMVRIIRSFLLSSRSQIKTAQSVQSVNSLMLSENSWVVESEKGDRFTKYDAFIELVDCSWILYPFLFIFKSRILKFIGSRVYHWVSNHRHLMGKFSQYFILIPERKEIITARVLSFIFGLFICMTLVMWNLTTIKKFEFSSPFFGDVTRYLHLYQEWNMFSPRPKPDSVWIEIPAELTDGTQIELLSKNRDIYSVKSSIYPQVIKSEHWRKFFFNITDRIDYGRYYANYLCRDWNEFGNEQIPGVKLRKLDINVYSQLNLLNNEKGGVIKKSTWSHWCFDKDFNEKKL